MPQWQCYYHLIWATKDGARSITPQIRDIVIESITKSAKSYGCDVLAINSVEDHFHAAVLFSPEYSIEEWVKRMKALSAREVNDALPDLDKEFRWHIGYGMVTFGMEELSEVIAYVEEQHVHHAQNTLIEDFERIEE